MCSLGIGHFKEHFLEIIWNLGQWLISLLKAFLFLALVAILFGGAESNVQFW